MPKENNKMQVDIDTLKKQNVNDLLSIKEIYSKLEEIGEKITKIKYIDNTLVKKIKKEYENLNKIILDENIQVQLDNKIDDFNLKLTHDIETINSYNSQLTNDIETINSQLNSNVSNIINYNIKNYGASEELDDNANIINTLISQISTEKGGGNILIPKGTFKTSQILLKDNVNIIGTGEESILKNKYINTNWKHVINIQNSKNNVVQNIQIDGNYSGEYSDNLQQSHCISIDRSENVVINNCLLKNSSGDGIWIADSSSKTKIPKNIEINNCKFKDNKRQNIALVHGEFIKITGCQGNGQLDVEVEPHTSITNNIFIQNNIFNRCSLMNLTSNKAFLVCDSNIFNSVLLWQISEFKFINNIVNGRLRTYCIQDCIIQSNTFKSLDLTGTDNKKNINIIISGNKIINVDDKISASDSLSSKKACVVFWGCSNVSFTNNEIKTNDTYNAIDLTTNNDCININGNTLTSLNSEIVEIDTCGINITTNGNTDITIKLNNITNFNKGIYSSGATKVQNLNIIDNNIYSYSNPLALAMINNLNIKNNIFTSIAKNTLLYCDNSFVVGNKIIISATSSVFDIFNSNTVEISKNDYSCVDTANITIYNSSSIYLNEDFKNISLAASGTTSFLSHSKYYNNKSNSIIGKIYINDAWSNLTI